MPRLIIHLKWTHLLQRLPLRNGTFCLYLFHSVSSFVYYFISQTSQSLLQRHHNITGSSKSLSHIYTSNIVVQVNSFSRLGRLCITWLLNTSPPTSHTPLPAPFPHLPHCHSHGFSSCSHAGSILWVPLPMSGPLFAGQLLII